MSLRNMGIGLRASLSFAVLASLLVLIGLLGLGQLSKLRKSITTIEASWMPGIEVSHDSATTIARIRLEALRLLSTDNLTTQRQSKTLITHEHIALEERLTRYKALLNNEPQRKMFMQLQDAVSGYMSVLAQMTLQEDKHQQQQAMDLFNNRLASQGLILNKSLEALMVFNLKGVKAAVNSAIRGYENARWVVSATIFLALATTLLLAWLLTRSITTPLGQALNVARFIAAGDLNTPITVRGQDEPAQLLAALAHLQAHWRSALRGISQSVQQLAASAEETNAVITQSQRELNAQNAEIQQAVRAVTRISCAMAQVASQSASSADASQACEEDSKHGHYQISTTIGATERLASEVLDASGKAKSLVVKAEDIGKVLELIRGIAGHTNLLALNAATDASQDSVPGQDVSLIADEVRALAQRTQDASEEIEQVIIATQQGAQDTASALHSSAEQAGQTLQRASNASSALEKISACISQISQRNRAIACAVEQQALETQEMELHLKSIRDLSTQTAASAAQASAASQQLSRLAVELNALATGFAG